MVYFALIGAVLGLWILMLVDLGRRDISSGARVVWFVLLIFAPVVGLVVYYLAVVKRGVGVSDAFRAQAGQTLITAKGRRVTVLSVLCLSVVLAFFLAPASIEVPATRPTTIPEGQGAG